VDGVLRHSLYSEVLISLGKQQMSEAIDAPWKYPVEVSASRNRRLLEKEKHRLCSYPGDQKKGAGRASQHNERPEMMILRLPSQRAPFCA
jgi:hypothetical protein